MTSLGAALLVVLGTYGVVIGVLAMACSCEPMAGPAAPPSPAEAGPGAVVAAASAVGPPGAERLDDEDLLLPSPVLAIVPERVG